MNRFLILFAKAPVPGQVKTRLCEALGPEGAAVLYRAFLSDLLDLCRRVPCEQRIIAYSPEGGYKLFTGIRGFTIRVQRGEDLGRRMEEAFSWAFSSQASSVVVVGSDSPSLPEGYVENAFALLQTREVVLGPSWDGGYYLIGMAKHAPGIFDGIAWSTHRVFEQTVDKITTMNVSLGLLSPWYDVDRPEDLRFLASHIRGILTAGERVPCPESYRVLQELIG